MDITTCLLGVGLILIVYWFFSRTDQRLPPYPSRPLPVIGHMLTVNDDLRPQFKKWRKELGDIFSLKMGGTLVVVLNGYDLMKEVLIKRADEFSERAMFFMDLVSGSPGKGITFANGQNWKENRSVTLSILREFGMGKNVLAEKIQSEVVCYMDYISRLDGQATNMQVVTNMSIANVICAFIVGDRFDYDDTTFQTLMSRIRAITGDQTTTTLVNFFPVLNKLPGDFFGGKMMASNMQKVADLFRTKFIGRHNDDETNNFVAAYLSQMKKKLSGGQTTLLDEDNLVKIMLELFLAGGGTTSTSLLWCYIYALSYQDVQEKIYKEIEEEIGTVRVPTMQDRTKLVYLNAFLNEVARISSLAAHSFAHSNKTDTEIRGYRIPKGSFIVPNLDSIHFDKKIWGQDVMAFKPERFIDSEGKLKNPEELVPFGIGRRICMGESMTKMIQFLMMASLIQRFKILPSDPKSPPPIKYEFGLDVAPAPFEVRFVDRRK
ncbi:cytochrome P450 2U1-like [Physella acuta]|uniref:cytochrome P450 2U1-like n=1 Tax=Physella acuta TaxID=109671 RepID=UPI0027DDFDEA|nr:cytochrome P450 2U1-like [Physella acuta]